MRIIMSKTKIRTKQLQQEELNIIDSLGLIDATIQNSKQIRKNSAMKAELASMKSFAEKEGMDAMAQYQRHHQNRSQPR